MKRIACMILLVMVGCLAAGCGDVLSVQSRSFNLQGDTPVKRVAVVDFAGEYGQAVADILTMHLLRAGYEVVERQYLSDILRGAIEPTQEGHTDASLSERLSKIGKIINADAVITGDLVKLKPAHYSRAAEDRLKYEGSICQISARAFDVRTREVYWTAVVDVTASARNGQQLKTLDYLNEACAELVVSMTQDGYKGGSWVFEGSQIAQRRQERASLFTANSR